MSSEYEFTKSNIECDELLQRVCKNQRAAVRHESSPHWEGYCKTQGDYCNLSFL